MNIYFLTDEQAKKLGISYLDFIKVKEYPFCPSSVVVNNTIYSERKFIKRLDRTALRILREGK